MILFSLNAKRRVPLHKQSLLKQRQIDHNVQQNKPELYMRSQVKDINTIVKDVITYDIGESSNDMDLIAPEPQMEEPVIETLSSVVANVVANNNETIEKESSIKVPAPVLESVPEEVFKDEEVSGDNKDKEVELNKKRRKRNVRK
jgi:hypothetical protein